MSQRILVHFTTTYSFQSPARTRAPCRCTTLYGEHNPWSSSLIDREIAEPYLVRAGLCTVQDPSEIMQSVAALTLKPMAGTLYLHIHRISLYSMTREYHNDGDESI